MQDFFSELEKSIPGVIFEAPPGKLLEVLRCLRVLVNEDDFFFNLVPPLCLEYHLKHSSMFSFSLTSTLKRLLSYDSKTLVPTGIKCRSSSSDSAHGGSLSPIAAPVVSVLLSRENHLVSYASDIIARKKQHGGPVGVRNPNPCGEDDVKKRADKANNNEEEEDINVWDEIQEESVVLTALEEYLQALKVVEVFPIEGLYDMRSSSGSDRKIDTEKEAEEEEDLFASLVENSATNVGAENIQAVFFDTRLRLYVEVDPVHCCCIRVFPFPKGLRSCRIENKEAADIILSIEDPNSIATTTSDTSVNPSLRMREAVALFPSSHLRSLLERTFQELIRSHYHKVHSIGETYKRRSVGVALPPSFRPPPSFPSSANDASVFSFLSENIGDAGEIRCVPPLLTDFDLEVNSSFQLIPLVQEISPHVGGLFPYSLPPDLTASIPSHDVTMVEGVNVVYSIFWISKKENLAVRWKTSLSIVCQHYPPTSPQSTASATNPVLLTLKGRTSTRFFMGATRPSAALHARSTTPLSVSTLVNHASTASLRCSSSTSESISNSTSANAANRSEEAVGQGHHDLADEVLKTIKNHLKIAGEQMKHAVFCVSTKKGWETFRSRSSHSIASCFFSHS